jgi:hypothetical protein
MDDSNEADEIKRRIECFRAYLKKERSNYEGGAENFRIAVAVATTIAVILLAMAAVFGVAPDFTLQGIKFGKWLSTVLIAVGGAIYFLINQLKWQERSNWHYWYLDEIDRVLRMLCLTSAIPPTKGDLIKACSEYDKIVKLLGVEGDKISASIVKPPRHRG